MTLGLILWHIFQLYLFSSLSGALGEQLGYGGRAILEFAILVQFGISLVVFIGIAGIWKWKKWGYHLMLGAYGLNVMLSIFGAGAFALGVNLGIAIAIYRIIGDIDPLLD